MAKSSTSSPLHILLAVLLLGGLALGETKKKPSSDAKAKATKPAPKPKPTPPPPPPPLAPGELPLVARSAVLIDAKTGDVLYEKNAGEVEYPASTTKILTALLVIEAGNLDQWVTIEPQDTKVEASALEIKAGEQYVRRDLLFALLLKSANDVALALARDNAGSVEAFAAKMNRRAGELGATESHFTNPHGLHNPHHFTTAQDLARIARAAMQNPLFREIICTPEIGMTRGDEWVIVRSHNRLLQELPGCIGGKTGFTNMAQQVLVSSAIRAGTEAIAVVMHTSNAGRWEDSKTLLEHGFVKLGVPPPTTPAPPVAPIALPPIDAEPATAGQGTEGK